MAILELLPMDAAQVHYNIPHLPIRLETWHLMDAGSCDPHWHEDLEILLVLEGSIVIRTRQRELPLQRGEAFVFNTRQLHAVTCGLGKHARLFSVHLDLRPLVNNYTLNVTLLYPLFFDASSDGFFLSVPEKDLLSLLSQIMSFETDRPLGYPLELTGLLSIFLGRLCRVFLPARGNQIPAPDVAALESMIGYISRFYTEKIMLSDIAAAGKVGRSKCCEIFRSYLGLSPIDFLNSYRLSVSRELLITTPHKVSVIAASCGFSHQSYYSQLFREKYGYTPNEYRQQNVKDSPNF